MKKGINTTLEYNKEQAHLSRWCVYYSGSASARWWKLSWNTRCDILNVYKDLIWWNRKRAADKTCRREQEVRMKEGWSDRQTDMAGGGMKTWRKNQTRARWRGGTEETGTEIEWAKERVSHKQRGGGIHLSLFAFSFISLSGSHFLSNLQRGRWRRLERKEERELEES